MDENMTDQKKTESATQKLDDTQLDAAVGGAAGASDASIILCRKNVNTIVPCFKTANVAPCFKTAKSP